MINKAPSYGIALLALAAALAFVPAGLAARGGGKAANDAAGFAVVPLDSIDGAPHWGNHVTFHVATTAPWPSVTLTCSQGGVAVLTQSAGFWADYGPGQVFGLMNGTWTGGAGDCTATLDSLSSNGKTTTLATTSFHVEA